MTTASFWSSDPSRAERCKQLWAEGYSATQIGADLGTTRNAVISKVHRHNWTGPHSWSAGGAVRRGAKRTAAQRRQRAAETRAAKVAALLGEPLDPAAQDEAVTTSYAEGGARPLASLLSGDCHWPLGHPTDHDFAFCAAPAIAGLPYCAPHVRIAYQPAASRRRGGHFSWGKQRATAAGHA